VCRIYDALINLIRERLPNGPQLLEHWEKIQARHHFNLREDCLSWIDGGLGCITLPAERGGCAEHVFFLRLKNEEKARQVIRDAFNKAKDFLAARGQSLEAVEIPGLGQDLRELRIGAFPWLRPVAGMPGDVFVIASSVSAVKRVAATFMGQAPNFRENPACAALGLPDGPLAEIYYGDLRGGLQGPANLVSAVGFFASVLPAHHDTRHARKVGTILTKFAAFLRALDLGVDYGGWSRYDPEKHAIFSTSVTRIRQERADF